MAARSKSGNGSGVSISRLGRWAGVGFLMAWAFFLGILVGQGYLASPEQLAYVKESLGLEGWPQAEAPPAGDELRSPELSFYEKVVETEPPGVVRSEMPPTPAAPAALPTASPVQPASATPASPAVSAPALAGQQEAPAQPPASGETPGAQPLQATPPPGGAPGEKGVFIVQVASMKDEVQARILVIKLSQHGHPAYLTGADLPGVGVRYRVRVGPFNSREQAEIAAVHIRSQQRMAAYVTRAE